MVDWLLNCSIVDIVYDYHSEEDEKVEERVFMKTWNPVSQIYINIVQTKYH